MNTQFLLNQNVAQRLVRQSKSKRPNSETKTKPQNQIVNQILKNCISLSKLIVREQGTLLRGTVLSISHCLLNPSYIIACWPICGIQDSSWILCKKTCVIKQGVQMIYCTKANPQYHQCIHKMSPAAWPSWWTECLLLLNVASGAN